MTKDEFGKSDIDKLLQIIRRIPPHVDGTPINRNEFIMEVAEEVNFKNFTSHDYVMIALELFKLIEDIEKMETIADGENALRSLLRELTIKRFIYLSQEKVNELKINKK